MMKIKEKIVIEESIEVFGDIHKEHPNQVNPRNNLAKPSAQLFSDPIDNTFSYFAQCNPKSKL